MSTSAPSPASRSPTHAAAEGGATAGFIDNNDWISFQPYNLSNATRFTARVASAGAGGTIEVRAGSPTGTLLGTATVAGTGGLGDVRRTSPPR